MKDHAFAQMQKQLEAAKKAAEDHMSDSCIQLHEDMAVIYKNIFERLS